MRVKEDHNEETIEFFKNYDNDASRERVNLNVVIGPAGLAGKMTRFNSDGSSVQERLRKNSEGGLI